jgi:sugar transferase (PEP-CTERM/EpsH1 system associated)
MKLMIFLSRFPYPLEKGDKLRAFYQIKELSKHFEIYLFAANYGKVEKSHLKKLSPYCKEIEVVKLSKAQILWNLIKSPLLGLPFHVGYFFSTSVKKRAEEFARKINPDRLYCQLIRTAPFVEDIEGIKILDFQDAFSLNASRRAERASFLKPILLWESKMLLAYEHKMAEIFKRKVIISEPDRVALKLPKENIVIVPNGIDNEFFSPRIVKKKYSISFVGNMSYPPNVDAVQFLANSILHLVWKVKPDVTFLIAGANPTSAVRQLANEKIKVTGWVEDIRDAYAEAELFIAPMRIGSGLQNKLLEAMAMGIPSITTKLANDSLGAQHNHHLLVGETAEELAALILEVLSDKELCEKIGAKGLQFVLENYGWNESTQPLVDLIKQ